MLLISPKQLSLFLVFACLSSFALGQGLTRVMIDPGHGGHDGGCTSASSTHLEKDLNLQIARELGDLLRRRRGIEIVYTRTDDTFVVLGERGQRANKVGADLFISIHCNASPKSFAAHRLSGLEVFILGDNGKDEHLKYVTERENSEHNLSSEQKGNNDMFDDILDGIAQEDYLLQSEMVQGFIFEQFKKKDSPICAKRKGKANFNVLRNAAMPAVLIEVGYLTNLLDEAVLTSEEGRGRVVDQLYKGIAFYDDKIQQLSNSESLVARDGSVVFRIQLSSNSTSQSISKFNIGDLQESVIERFEDGRYRYYYGAFNTREAAEYDLRYLKELGYTDAFIRSIH